MGKRFGAAVFLLGAVIAAGGCADETRHPPADEAFETVYRAAGDQGSARGERAEKPKTAATVGGRPVQVDAFRRYWRSRRDLERSEVVDRVIDREVSVGRGLDGLDELSSELALARKREMVRELLRDTIESKIGPDDLEAEAIEGRMKTLRRKVSRPPGFRVTQLTIGVPRRVVELRKKGKTLNAAQEKLYDRARQVAGEVRADFPEAVDVQTIYGVADKYRARMKANEELSLAVSPHIRLVRSGTFDKYGDPPEDWVVVEEFSEIAAGLADADRLQRVSKVFDSRFGAHLMVVEEKLPAKVPVEDQLREVAVSQLLTERRNQRLQQLMAEWGDGAELATYPGRLDEEKR